MTCLTSLKSGWLQSVDSTATLSDIPYGVNGDWAINLWLKLATGATHAEAVFSHTSQLLQNTSSALWGPNQVLTANLCYLS